MHPVIESVKNTKIKELLALKRPRGRKKYGLFSVEGVREISLALEVGYLPKHIFFCPDIIDEEHLYKMGVQKETMIPIVPSIFEKMVYRKTTGGVIAVFEWKSRRLEDLMLRPKPLLLVLQSIEKPGNWGALLRTADAAGVDAVIICDAHTDLYNPNTIRSSMGCLFTNQVVSTTSEEAIAWLKKKGIKIYITVLERAVPYQRGDYNQPCAFVMGAESVGLDEKWKGKENERITVPMCGKIDSMNVSVTAGIVIFEALRQREAKGFSS